MKPGDKINKFTFIEFAPPKIRFNGIKRKMGVFQCDCGDVKEYSYSKIKTGSQKHCRTCSIKARTGKGRTHGLCSHPLYGKWSDMKNRCYNKKVDRFESYGGRGIRVCKEWKRDFQAFYDWAISNGWTKELTIDRIDVEKDYCPSNCQFITHREQGFNKRNTFYVTIKGKKYSLAKLMYKNNMSKKYSTIWHGLKHGKTIEYYIKKLGIRTDVYTQEFCEFPQSQGQ